jgi:hypothetical protein
MNFQGQFQGLLTWLNEESIINQTPLVQKNERGSSQSDPPALVLYNRT